MKGWHLNYSYPVKENRQIFPHEHCLQGHTPTNLRLPPPRVHSKLVIRSHADNSSLSQCLLLGAPGTDNQVQRLHDLLEHCWFGGPRIRVCRAKASAFLYIHKWSSWCHCHHRQSYLCQAVILFSSNRWIFGWPRRLSGIYWSWRDRINVISGGFDHWCSIISVRTLCIWGFGQQRNIQHLSAPCALRASDVEAPIGNIFWTGAVQPPPPPSLPQTLLI